MKPDFAFYYPGQHWRDVDWIKNLICFFDGIAMLVPYGMPNPLRIDDDPVTWALEDHELIRVIRPEEVIDEKATEALAEAFGEIITSGRLDHLTQGHAKNTIKTDFEALAKAKLGVHIDQKLANSIFQTLYSKGLAYDTGDGVSVRMNRTVLALVLVLLAHILKPKGEDIGITLSPATDQRKVINILGELLKTESSPPAVGDIVSFDMAKVGVDFRRVPIDEILDFRQQHYCQHRDYILSVRAFARELSLMPPDEREAKFEQRQEELKDISHDLRKTYRVSWKTPFSFGIGLVGAAWAANQGDPIAGALAALAAVPALIPDEPQEVGVYSYLISAKRRF